MLIVEKCLKVNGEFCDESFVKTKEGFGKHSIPILQSSNVIVCEITNQSSNDENEFNPDSA
jgi:hypothetical protein